jgi:hypothetical protein
MLSSTKPLRGPTGPATKGQDENASYQREHAFSRDKYLAAWFLMYRHGLIQDADIQEFSQELREELLASPKE